jgi:hypothetical protein
MNGIEIGYLNASPFAALMLATMTQTTSRIPRATNKWYPYDDKAKRNKQYMYKAEWRSGS